MKSDMNLQFPHKKHTFSPAVLFVIIGCIAFNILFSRFVALLGLPIFLDSIGTIFCAALCGLLPGILTGFLSNALNSIADPITLYYGFISVVFAVIAALQTKRGRFRNIIPTLLSSFLYACIGGGLGSVLTFTLYGLSFGEGISAVYAHYLHDVIGFGVFSAQLSADFIIDVADKIITLILVYLFLHHTPLSLLEKLPLGYIYADKTVFSRISRRNPQRAEEISRRVARIKDNAARLGAKHFYRSFSLRHRVELFIITTSVILTSLATVIGYMLYRNAMFDRYVEICRSATSLVCDTINPDSVSFYLKDGRRAGGYIETEKRISQIMDAFPEIEYLYVYSIREDGCHVVFDMDTKEVLGEEPGTVIPFDVSFSDLIPTLLAGKEIDPIVTDDSYGNLMTVYTPLVDYYGTTVAYAAADVEMSTVISDRYVFVVQTVALLFGASIIITAFAIWFADRRIVRPINEMALTAGQYAFGSEAERAESSVRMQKLGIHTGDEIENLYNAVTKTVTDVSEFLNEIDEQNREITEKTNQITHIQNNVINSFASLVEARDRNTGSHIHHTSRYVAVVAHSLKNKMPYSDVITDEYLRNLVNSAPLHDIGKICITDTILNKPGRLTPEEFDIIKTHTVEGERILIDAMQGIEGNSYLSLAAQLARSHHEKYDGTGYPDGLSGKDIPLSARIMAIADVFDALISKRSYKEPIPFDEAMQIIIDSSGTHFDPDVVEAFVAVKDQIRFLSYD